MDPGTLGILGTIGSVAQGVMGFFGAQQQAQAQKDAAQYQAAVARNNEITAQQNAMYAAQAGRAQAQAQDFKNRATTAAITAAEGASGIEVDSPSSREVRESAQQLGRLDTLNIMQRANLQSRAYVEEATNFEADARLADLRARQASQAGIFGGFSSLLGGVTSFADKWLKYQNTTATGLYT